MKTKVIKLSKEASSALKMSPSDRRLIEVLNSNSVNKEACSKLQRWLAAQVLGSYGYKFEA